MTKDEETPNSKKLSWADQVEAEDNEEERALPHLPPRQVIGPDENGIKKVIEYKFNEAGDMVKVTSTYQVRKVCTKTSKRAIQRRSWPKFGDAVYDEASSRLTTVSTEEIFLQRPSSVKGCNFFLFLLFFLLLLLTLRFYCQERRDFSVYLLIQMCCIGGFFSIFFG